MPQRCSARAFIPAGGAYYLRAHHQERLASLVAYHSEAQYEAALRGLAAELAQFPRETSAVADALTYCDITTRATGLSVSRPRAPRRHLAPLR